VLIETFEQLINFGAGRQFVTLFNRGIAKLYLKQNKAALEDLDLAIRLNDKSHQYFLNRAFAKYNLEDFDGACMDWQKAALMGNEEGMKYYNNVCAGK
jgi:tetratricopeptide (TPR) repeat protein